MNYKGKTNILGFNVPNVILYGVILAVILFFFGVFKAIKNFISALFNKLGLGSDNKDQVEENDKEILRKIEKVPGVKNEINTGNKDKAEALLKAMNGMGTDSKGIYQIFKTILGPNQMGAIYKMYGRRNLSIMPWFGAGPAYPVALGANLFGGFSGTLTECLKNELSNSELNKNLGTPTVKWGIQTKLNWLNTF
jgi:hypothetical protein